MAKKQKPKVLRFGRTTFVAKFKGTKASRRAARVRRGKAIAKTLCRKKNGQFRRCR